MIPRFLAVVLSIVTVAACRSGSADAEQADVTARPAAFGDRFVMRDSVVLEQPESEPIVRVSGIARDRSGQLLLADASEGNVKLFASDGRLLRVFGRKGEGPGEFMAPRYPRFGPDGRIYVADGQNPRIQAFERDGRFVRSTQVRDAGILMGFEILSPTRYLVTAEMPGAREVLLEVDTSGTVTRRHLPIGEVIPTGEREFELWGNIRNFFLDVQRDTAFVASTVSDSLWAVDLATGAVTRTRLRFAGYIAPKQPAQPLKDLSEMTAWSRGFHLASTLSTADGRIYLPFVQGVLNFGDPMILATRQPDGTWSAVTGAPPILAASNDEVVALLHPGEERIVLGIFRAR